MRTDGIFAIQPSTSRGGFRNATSPLFIMGHRTSGTVLKLMVSKHIIVLKFVLVLSHNSEGKDRLKTCGFFWCTFLKCIITNTVWVLHGFYWQTASTAACTIYIRVYPYCFVKANQDKRSRLLLLGLVGLIQLWRKNRREPSSSLACNFVFSL